MLGGGLSKGGKELSETSILKIIGGNNSDSEKSEDDLARRRDNEEYFNFVTRCFFYTVRILELALGDTCLASKRFFEHQCHHELQLLQHDEGDSGISNSDHLRRLDILLGQYYCCNVMRENPSTLRRAILFCGLFSQWLGRTMCLDSTVISHHFPNCVHDKRMVKAMQEKNVFTNCTQRHSVGWSWTPHLPIPRRMAPFVHIMPLSLCNAIFCILRRAFEDIPQIVTANENNAFQCAVTSIVDFAITLVCTPQLLREPHFLGNISEMFSAMFEKEKANGRESEEMKAYRLSSMLFAKNILALHGGGESHMRENNSARCCSALAMRFLIPSLIFLYVDADRAGHYEKARLRSKIADAMSSLWTISTQKAIVIEFATDNIFADAMDIDAVLSESQKQCLQQNHTEVITALASCNSDEDNNVSNNNRNLNAAISDSDSASSMQEVQKRCFSGLFLRFAHGILTEANRSLLEGLSAMQKIHEIEVDNPLIHNIISDSNGDERSQLAESESMARHFMTLANKNIDMICMFSIHTKDPFLTDTLCSSLASTLCGLLRNLAGKHTNALKVHNPEQYHFDPKTLLSKTLYCIANFADESAPTDDANANIGGNFGEEDELAFNFVPRSVYLGLCNMFVDAIVADGRVDVAVRSRSLRLMSKLAIASRIDSCMANDLPCNVGSSGSGAVIIIKRLFSAICEVEGEKKKPKTYLFLY